MVKFFLGIWSGDNSSKTTNFIQYAITAWLSVFFQTKAFAAIFLVIAMLRLFL